MVRFLIDSVFYVRIYGIVFVCASLNCILSLYIYHDFKAGSQFAALPHVTSLE